MFKVCNKYLILFFIYCLCNIVNCKVNSNSNNNNDHFIKIRQSSNQMCIDTFDVYEDKIIRTQDSRVLGAKYLSERDVPTRDDCYQLCCNTGKCDVFVFEEKRPGSCYLFECGPPDDFKCKFTKHSNYTSGVSKHLSELETQIKFTQHEHELSNLREPENNGEKIASASISKSTVSPQGSKETLQLIPLVNKNQEKPHSGRCSRYQFECHTSHECIAVYNACDGIPQCADSSDEAPELGCPSQQGSVATVTKEPPKPSTMPLIIHDETYKAKEPADKAISPPETKSQMEKAPPHHLYGSRESTSMEKSGDSEVQPLPNTNSYTNMNPQRQLIAPNSRLAYGREGEGMAYRNNDNQWAYNERGYHPNQGNGQIFNHKSNGVITQNERYPQSHNFQDPSTGGNMAFNNEQPPNEYNRYYYENSQYRVGPQNQYGQGGWSSMSKPNELNSFPSDDGLVKGERYPNGGMLPQEYYYDENSYRGRQQMMDNRLQMIDGRLQGMDNRQMINNQQSVGQQQIQGQSRPVDNHAQSQTMYENRAHIELKNLAKTKQEEQKSLKMPPQQQVTSTLATTTVKPKVVKEEHHHQISHIKFEKLTADAAFVPTEPDGHNASPSGAILSLTFGLLITAVMVVLVGCRIRTVRRRLRRGGKSFAHDADFLVNGMYL